MSLKVINSRLQLNFPGASLLTNMYCVPLCMWFSLCAPTCQASPQWAWSQLQKVWLEFASARVLSGMFPQKFLVLINSLAHGKFEWNFRHVIYKQILVIDGWGISCEIALLWMSLASLMISQHWFRWWLGAVRQQVITWANVDPDLCRHMASLDPNELTKSIETYEDTEYSRPRTWP